jgi:small conductance mechanosensitive channel
VVAVSELGDSSVNLVVRPWCKGTDYWAVRFDLTRALKEGLEAAGCSFPFPQRDVHLLTAEESDAA